MNLNTEAVTTALKRTRGDIIEAAQLLTCKPREVAECIRGVDSLQNVMAAIRSEKAEHADWDRQSVEDFVKAIELRTALYRMEALEEIRDVAVMDAGENAELVKAKLQACFRLMGSGPMESTEGDLGAFLADLARRYQESAPRIKSLRVELELQRGGDVTLPAVVLPALPDSVSSIATVQIPSGQSVPVVSPAKAPRARSRARQKQT